jgi:hypothetical protein
MNVRDTENPDAIIGSALVILKYIIEQSLCIAASAVQAEDPMFDSLRKACSAPISEDMLSTILMGYCVAEKDALHNNMVSSIDLLKKQIAVLEESIGG